MKRSFLITILIAFLAIATIAFPAAGGCFADFSATPRSGSAPLTVDFTNETYGSCSQIHVFNWSFGDGTVYHNIIEPDPQHGNTSHTYTAAGSYDVNFSIYYTGHFPGSPDASMVKSFYIMVTSGGSEPIASFTASPTSGPSPLQVQFTDTSTNTPTWWSWCFGDDSNSTEQNPLHTYGTPGTYNVNLTAGNAHGYDYETKIGYVTVTVPPPTSSGGGGGGGGQIGRASCRERVLAMV
jgi:PKD repeat protein